MPCTNDHKEAFTDLASETCGKQEDSVSKTTKTCNHKDKALGRPPSIWPQLQNHGTISQFPWISTEWELQEETGEDEAEDNQKGMSPELTIQGPKEGYRVCALTVENKDTSLAIVP